MEKKIIHIRPTDFFIKRTSEQHVICQSYYDLFLYLLKVGRKSKVQIRVCRLQVSSRLMQYKYL